MDRTDPQGATPPPGGTDALSQRDIDQLLGRARRGPAQPLVATPYNFLRPPRVSKDRRVTLEAIFSRVGASLQATFSSRLRTPVDVICAVEQATFSEFVLGVSSPCAAFVFGLGASVRGEGVVDLGLDLAFLVVDRVFGGPGEPIKVERPLTMLERSVVRGFIDKLLATLREAWADHLALAPEVTGFESTPDMLRVASREDNVLAVRFDVRVGGFESYIGLCLPLLSLESFLAEKTRGTAAAASTPAQRRLVESALLAAHVGLAVRLPPLRLSAREIARLRPGQIITTTQPIDAPVELHVNGRCRFVGTLGQYRRTLGLKVTQPAGPRDGTGRPTRGRIQ